MACIILKEDETVTEDEMKAFISASMARHKARATSFLLINSPMNAAGKIQKYVMRENAVQWLKEGKVK